MASAEQGGPHHPHDQDPRPAPTALPPELAAFLVGEPLACLLHETDQGSAFVIKAPARDIEGLRGRLPIHLRHELYDHPAAPVICTVLTLYDRPETPLALESFTNVGDLQQRAEFAALATQAQLILLFYDETLAHRLTKLVPHRQAEDIPAIVATADRLAAAIPADHFDFDRAKADVLATTGL